MLTQKKEDIMKKSFLGFFLLFVFLLSGTLVFAEMPGPDAPALWDYITKESPYKKWSFWPDHHGMQPGRAPHGPLHKVYINDKTLSSSKTPIQYGGIIVKENYSKSKELKAITLMYKIKDYNPDGGDWFWVKYGTDGKADVVGKPKGCIGCHGSHADNDFIFVHEFK
jgi:hypothetical protein